MTYRIYDIRNVEPQAYPYYFIDTNVWIAELKQASITVGGIEQNYTNFFEAIISLNQLEGKAAKKAKNQPKILITSLLLSEIINTYLRRIAMYLCFGEGVNKKPLKRITVKIKKNIIATNLKT